MPSAEKIRWGAERRLEFIEFRLYWEGGIRRADITEKFGVSVPQASADIGAYQLTAPSNLVYDASEKRYVSTPDFRPVFLDLSAESYLVHLRDAAEDRVRLVDSWLGSTPSVAVMPLPSRRVKSDVLRSLVTAIRETRSVEVLYQSMNKENTEKTWRRLSPHSLVNDGARWHVRAYCSKASAYRDFLLSRCEEAKNIGPAEGFVVDDKSWNELFEVLICPNPKLTEFQKKGIAEDYGMIDGKMSIRVRKALLFYFEKILRLDVPEIEGKPAATPLRMMNGEEFRKALQDV